MADLEAELRKAEQAARAASQGPTTTGPTNQSARTTGADPGDQHPHARPEQRRRHRPEQRQAPPASTTGPASTYRHRPVGRHRHRGPRLLRRRRRRRRDRPTRYPFPPYCPDREFALNGETVRIGRSGKRGPVEIDLSGPPTDPGVSHLHAVLQQRPDGGWQVVDLESMNGTVLNDDTAPIPPNQAFPVEAGYRIHVGVWTTLTLIQRVLRTPIASRETAVTGRSGRREPGRTTAAPHTCHQ